MSKKLIAILSVATIIFVCVFAACEKKGDEIYIDDKEYEFVTDENGEKVLADDGQLIIYETDSKGKFVTDENGERATYHQQFQPIENDGKVEDYGYKIILPDGWSTTDIYGNFVNKKKDIECEISVAKYFYKDYYAFNYDVYEQLKKDDVDVSWEKDLDLGDDYKGVCRFTMKAKNQVTILYFFENSGNVYKILFKGTESDSLTADTEAFCKAMEMKPYTYYDDITAVSQADK